MASWAETSASVATSMSDGSKADVIIPLTPSGEKTCKGAASLTKSRLSRHKKGTIGQCATRAARAKLGSVFRSALPERVLFLWARTAGNVAGVLHDQFAQ